MKTDLAFGDSLMMMMTSGTSAACKQERVEVSLCKMHLGENRERVKDISCEQAECLAKGMLANVGENVVRGCNEHIGIRITHETDIKQESLHNNREASGKGMTAGGDNETHGVRQVMPDNRNADPCVVIITDDGVGGYIFPGKSSTMNGSYAKEHARSYGGTKPKTSAISHRSSARWKSEGRQKAPGNHKVFFQDPANAEDDTSSEQEEYQMGRIWGNKEADRRLSLETGASEAPKRRNIRDKRVRDAPAGRKRKGEEREWVGVGVSKQGWKRPL